MNMHFIEDYCWFLNEGLESEDDKKILQLEAIK